MSRRLVAQRYAQGLSESISNPNDLEGAAEALTTMAAQWRDNAAVRITLESPAVYAATRQTIIAEILKAINAPELLSPFFSTLLKRDRLSLLPDIAGAFDAVASKRLGKAIAKVATAIEMTPEQENRMRAALSSYAAKDVRLATSVNPDLVGGVIVEMEGKIFDGSLRSRLTRMKHAVLAEEK